MGNVVRLPKRTAKAKAKAYAPINYRASEDCVLMLFPEGSRERQLYHYEGIQYCRGELAGNWFYVIHDPETGERGMFWVTFLEDGYCVRDYMGSPVCRNYAKDKLRIVGRAFQFIFDLSSDERIEIIRGPAVADEENVYRRPLLDIQVG